MNEGFLDNDLKIERNTALLEAIISLARGIGAEVVAEGVETDEQYSFVKQQGCQRAQGYMISKPLSTAKFEETYSQFKDTPILTEKHESTLVH